MGRVREMEAVDIDKAEYLVNVGCYKRMENEGNKESHSVHGFSTPSILCRALRGS